MSVAAWCRESLVEPLLSVLFPPRCVGCGDFEVHLCESCRATLVEAGRECCPRCGEPGPKPLVCGRCSACMTRELEYRSARSAFCHEGVARSLVSELKFGGQPVLGRLMADLARPAFRDFVASTAPPAEVFATWVPSHKSAKRERGYNQAEILARELASGPPLLSCAELVAKTAGTAHQKGLGRADRLSNLRGAFSPRPDIEKRISSPVIGSPRMGSSGLRHGKGRQGTGSVLRYSAIILVDDVYTTGATAAAVSSVLALHTGLPVHVFTFSRAVAPRGQGHD